MNWGYRIAIAFVLFASFIGYIVVRSSMTKIELVENNYYERELEYDKVIVAKQNTAALGELPKVTFANNNVKILFPLSIANFNKGECVFKRPSNEKMDKTIALNLLDGVQLVSGDLFTKGMYAVAIQWENGGKQFLSESELIIN